MAKQKTCLEDNPLINLGTFNIHKSVLLFYLGEVLNPKDYQLLKRNPLDMKLYKYEQVSDLAAIVLLGERAVRGRTPLPEFLQCSDGRRTIDVVITEPREQTPDLKGRRVAEDPDDIHNRMYVSRVFDVFDNAHEFEFHVYKRNNHAPLVIGIYSRDKEKGATHSVPEDYQ